MNIAYVSHHTKSGIKSYFGKVKLSIFWEFWFDKLHVEFIKFLNISMFNTVSSHILTQQ